MCFDLIAQTNNSFELAVLFIRLLKRKTQTRACACFSFTFPLFCLWIFLSEFEESEKIAQICFHSFLTL